MIGTRRFQTKIPAAGVNHDPDTVIAPLLDLDKVITSAQSPQLTPGRSEFLLNDGEVRSVVKTSPGLIRLMMMKAERDLLTDTIKKKL